MNFHAKNGTNFIFDNFGAKMQMFLKKLVSYYIEIQLKIMNFCAKNGTKFIFANFGAKIQMGVSSRIIRDNFGNRKITLKSRFYCTLLLSNGRF